MAGLIEIITGQSAFGESILNTPTRIEGVLMVIASFIFFVIIKKTAKFVREIPNHISNRYPI